MRLPLTPLDFLQRAERLFAPLEAVVEGNRRITYGEFAARCHALGALLRDEGVRRGDRVAYLCPNTLELLEAYYGVLLAGAVLVPLNIRSSPAELGAVVADCRPRVAAVHPSLAARGGDLDVAVLELGPTYERRLERLWGSRVDPGEIDEDGVCEIFYTSGTTGMPKGAMLTHRNLHTHAVDSALTMGCTHRDVVLHTIPLFHVNGWGTPHWVTALGARHVLLERFDAGDVLRLIGTERVTRLHLVPAMATMLVAHDAFGRCDTSSLVQVTVGGAPPGADLLASLEDGLGCEVVCGYGLTEASPQLTKAMTTRAHDALGGDEQRRRRATTGLPNLGVDLRVLDDGDREVAWDGCTVGEVCVRSNHVMAGYWESPEATAEALRGGWLRTGDLATVDAEGYVAIVDRKKDVIISGGENISSIELERVLCSHPAVLEAAVVAMRDDRWGEVPRAFVVARPGSLPPPPEELAAWVAERLARFAVPKRIEVVGELPRGGSGKVLKRELRERP